MPTGKHEHIKTYDLKQLKKDSFSEMTPIFKNAEIKFEDIGEYMQNYHNENDLPFNKGKKLIGSYFGKEIWLYTPLLKWYLQQGFKITKFHCAIKYTPEKSFQQFADEVSDARRAKDIDKAYELIAETMNLFWK